MNNWLHRFLKVPQAPTNPHDPGQPPARTEFDVASLYQGPLDEPVLPDGEVVVGQLDEKMRQAYFWIVNTAIISPFYDMEYSGSEPARVFQFGDSGCQVRLPSDQSYSSFVLLPLLNLAVRRRCLLVGGPGRGKTATAILMGLLAGYNSRDIKRAIQHGQPQMTVADLLGNPLPADLVSAQSMDDIRIAWRKWLGMRIKIIDEYNRIPTRTQSALLTVLADGYAEIYDQIFECPDAAWYLTANDDAGGGTYQVIEALKDRIDLVVRALHFNTRFLGDLLARIEAGIKPENLIPESIVFTEEELDQVEKEVRSIVLPAHLRRRLEFFCSQFEFAELAAEQLEYKTKDTVKLAGVSVPEVLGAESGKDVHLDLGRQTMNGLSVRALMTMLTFAKALAWFRGNKEVEMEDIRQILPFTLHDKLVPNPNAEFFQQPGREVFRTDRIGWIRALFDLSCQEYDRLGRDQDDPVGRIGAEFSGGLEGLTERDVQQRLETIEALLRQLSEGGKLYGHLYDDVLLLKYYHQRYRNYLRWLKWKQ